MESDDPEDEVLAIRAIIARQFASLRWTRGTSADWAAFASDFFPNATLFPAARPAASQTVPEFVARMKHLAETKLRSFHEAVLGSEVHVFGNVAVAIAACEMTEDDAEVTRGVEMLLLVKHEGAWQIVSQAWDRASPANPIPARLRAGTGSS
jgi:hypothetical protein